MNPQELLECAQDNSEAGRRRLATSVSRFFETYDLTVVEQDLAGDILLTLIYQAEADLREALAERLSLQNNVPAELMIYLANDQLSVARHVLQHSPVLGDIDLMHIIASKDPEYWRLIAQRDTLSPSLTGRLADTGDAGTALKLLGNRCISLEKPTLKKLVKASLTAEELQAPLLRRPEVDADIAADLYMVVSEALRQEIFRRFPAAQESAGEALESLVVELCAEAKGQRRTTPEMAALARRFNARKDVTPDFMIRALRRGQQGFFIALFAERAGLLPELVVRLIQKDGGKPFAVACRHVGMMKSEFASIFLLSRGIRTGEKIVDAQELAAALRSFDELKDSDMRRIMNSWLQDPTLI